MLDTRWENHVEAVKAIRYEVSKIIDALVHLANSTKDYIAKSEVKSLVTNELENFDFLFGSCIWCNMLNVVNGVSKLLQSENMHIDVAIGQLQDLITFFEDYRESGFNSTMINAKEIAKSLYVEPKFHKK